MKREECECDLQFAGFVVIACPLKSDSKAAIKQIQESSHHVRITSEYRAKKNQIIVSHQKWFGFVQVCMANDLRLSRRDKR